MYTNTVTSKDVETVTVTFDCQKIAFYIILLHINQWYELLIVYQLKLSNNFELFYITKKMDNCIGIYCYKAMKTSITTG